MISTNREFSQYHILIPSWSYVSTQRASLAFYTFSTRCKTLLSLLFQCQNNSHYTSHLLASLCPQGKRCLSTWSQINIIFTKINQDKKMNKQKNAQTAETHTDNVYRVKHVNIARLKVLH